MDAWYQDKNFHWSKLLLPLSVIFAVVSFLRRLVLTQVLPPKPHAVPLIVVGNISVGGTGKTPVIMALVEEFKNRGLKPGVVSRGYGGENANYPLLINDNTKVTEAGEEPYMIAKRLDIPVVVDPNRSRAVSHLLTAHPELDVILSDDGLQHYRLYRDQEVVVVDGSRGFGNGLLLPAGPLRETPNRLNQAAHVILHQTEGSPLLDSLAEVNHQSLWRVTGRALNLVNLVTGEEITPSPEQMGRQAYAVAGIGNPNRFYTSLTRLGFWPQLVEFPDHHRYRPEDLVFLENWPVIMTEKDAVKCSAFAQPHWWALQYKISLEAKFIDKLLTALAITKTCTNNQDKSD